MIRSTQLYFSVFGAIVITALGKLFFHVGGEYPLIPGKIAELFVNVVLMLLNTNDDWYVAPSYTYLVLNVVALAPLLYLVTDIYLQIQNNIIGVYGRFSSK